MGDELKPIQKRTTPDPKYICPACLDEVPYSDVDLIEENTVLLTGCPSCHHETALRIKDKPYLLDRLKAGGIS